MYNGIVEKVWATPQTERLNCKHCGETTHFRHRLGPIRMLSHGLLTAFTLGLWLPFWLADWGREKLRWTCESCGKKRGLFRLYASTTRFRLPHADKWQLVMALFASLLSAFMYFIFWQSVPSEAGPTKNTVPQAIKLGESSTKASQAPQLAPQTELKEEAKRANVKPRWTLDRLRKEAYIEGLPNNQWQNFVQALNAISARPDCLEITDSSWAISKKMPPQYAEYFYLPGKTGYVFRATCRVSDLPRAIQYDNFWLAANDLGNPDVIYRQTKSNLPSKENR